MIKILRIPLSMGCIDLIPCPGGYLQIDTGYTKGRPTYRGTAFGGSAPSYVFFGPPVLQPRAIIELYTTDKCSILPLRNEKFYNKNVQDRCKYNTLDLI